jgi:hypothetical protein
MPRPKSANSRSKSKPLSQPSQVSYQPYYVWARFLFTLGSLGLLWQRFAGAALTDSDGQPALVIPTDNTLNPSSYEVQFPSLVPLTIGALSYQLTGNTAAGLLAGVSSWTSERWGVAGQSSSVILDLSTLAASASTATVMQTLSSSATPSDINQRATPIQQGTTTSKIDSVSNDASRIRGGVAAPL